MLGRRVRPARADARSRSSSRSQAGAPWLAMQFPPDYVLDSDRLLYTAHYSTPFDKTARQCGLLLDEWTEVIPGTTRTTGITFNFDRPDNEPPQSILLVTPATGERHLAVGRPRRRAQRDARPRQEARGRAGAARRHAVLALPAGDRHGGDALRHLDHDRARRRQRRLPQPRRWHPMPSALPGRRHPRGARRARLFPTITIWNRLEGRPRTPSFDRALQRRGARRAVDADQAVADGRVPRQRRRLAGLREAADRDDAADQVPARRRRPTQLFDDDVPLEAKVERRPVPLHRRRPISLDLRLAMGRQWLALIAGVGDYRQAFIDAYPIAAPDPTASARTPTCCAHPEVWQTFAAVAGRAMDGGASVRAPRSRAPATTPTTASPAIDPGDHGALDDRARAVPRLVRAAVPAAPAERRRRLDAAAARVPVRHLGAAAGRHREGLRRRGVLHRAARLVQPRRRRRHARSIRSPARTSTGLPPDAPRTMIPVPVSFSGMPNTRWWAFEDTQDQLRRHRRQHDRPGEAAVHGVRARLRQRLVRDPVHAAGRRARRDSRPRRHQRLRRAVLDRRGGRRRRQATGSAGACSRSTSQATGAAAADTSAAAAADGREDPGRARRSRRSC